MKTKIIGIFIVTLLTTTALSMTGAQSTVDDNNPPFEPSDPNPKNNSRNVEFYNFSVQANQLNLSWTGGDPDVNDTVVYDIYFGTVNPPSLLQSNHISEWIIINDEIYSEGLRPDTQYYWGIVALDNHSAFNASEIWTFKTKDYPPYVREWTYSPPNPAPGEEITFDASSSFGIGEDVEYLWLWCTRDGEFLENVGSNPIAYHTYDFPDSHIQIRLRVYDDDGEYRDWVKAIEVRDPAEVPPLTPGAPQGKTSGKIDEECIYAAVTTDPNGDEIYYMFDWGDGTFSEWIGPAVSGVSVETTHKWTKAGQYEIRVKAFDRYYHEGSEWSDPLVVSMPKNKPINAPFLQFLENHSHMFPLLRHLLGL